MGPTIIARNYAETLLALALRHGGESAVDEYGSAMDEVSALLGREPRVRRFLATPLIEVDAKKDALRAALGGRVPELFLRFLLVVLDKRRQGLLDEIAVQYHELVDARRGVVRAEIVLAHEPDEALEQEIVRALSQRIGRPVLPRFRVDARLVGGVVIRIGDEVLDGSLQRRISGLRRRLLAAPLPGSTAA